MVHTNFEQLKNGCHAAFAEIHAKYSRRIFWVGKRMISDDFVVESLVQDTFLKLWIHMDRIETDEHIFFFLRFVMKRECISYYTRPRNKFFRKVKALESYDNFQDYLAGYDPIHDTENLNAQKNEQANFDRIKKILPLLNAEKRHLIDLCLKYSFQYKPISRLMGTSITETSNKVKMAITDIRSIINKGSTLESRRAPKTIMKVQGSMTDAQKHILELRCEENYSFEAIATALKLSQKEVHREFLMAYKLIQEKHQQQSQFA